MTGWRPVGSGVYYKTYTCGHVDGSSGARIRFGGDLEDEGYSRDGICVGAISWCPECAGPTWELHSLDPLHVEPSIQTTCHDHPAHHGWIRGGRWENAGDGYLPEPSPSADTSDVSDETKVEATPKEDGAGAVVHRNTPMLVVEVLPDVHCYIEGELVKPGDTAEVDGMCALGLVQNGHAKIIGSVEVKS